MFHHNTIRKYTLSLLNFFNRLEIQYKNESEQIITKLIPIHYKMREKLLLLDKSTTQILTGNTNVLPRAELEFTGLSVNNERQSSKFNKINTLRKEKSIEYQFNSVSYDFDFELKIRCRGMNEACQIIEQISPKFNPNVAIDIFDAENETEPTRVPLKMENIGFEVESFEEKSMNIITVTVSLKLSGYLFQPIKEYSKIKEYRIDLCTPYKNTERLKFDVIDEKIKDDYEIEYLDKTNEKLYLEILELKKENDRVFVIYETNSKVKPKVTFFSTNCIISQNETDMCFVKQKDNIKDFDILAKIELYNLETSIVGEFSF